MTDDGRKRFYGDRTPPLRPDEVARLRPVLGTGVRPPEVEALAATKSVYAGSDGGERPEVAVTDVGDGRWRVDVPLAPGESGHLHGRTKGRMGTVELLGAISDDVDPSGWRPDWIDMLPVPRIVPPNRRPTLRRFDGSAVRPQHIFDPENRTPFGDPSYPWGAIGRVFSSTGTTGTGVLVGPRLMITSGHLMPWAPGDWWVRFVPAYYNGASLHGAGVESYVSDLNGFAGNAPEPVGYDWTLCRLYEPLGDRFGYFGFNGYDDDWEDEGYWTLVGYPDLTGGEQPTYQTGIPVVDDDGDDHGGQEIEHRGDATDGNSGGPLFGYWSGDPRVIAVHSGEEEEIVVFPPGTEMMNVAAGGSGFGNLIAWGRSNWP